MKEPNNISARTLLNHTCIGRENLPPVLFVHGVGGSLSNWVFHYSFRLMQQYRCVAYDLRGHGQSPYPSEGYRLADHAEDLCQLEGLYPAAGGRRMVGYSYGGNIVLEWARRYGTAEDRILILDTPDLPVSPDTIREFVYDLQAVLGRDYSPKSRFAVQLVQAFRNKIEEEYRPARNYRHRLSQLGQTRFADEIILDQPFSDAVLAGIPCQVQLVYAARDCNLPYARRLMSLLQCCSLTVLDADHELVTTHSADIIHTMKEFF